MKNLIEIKHFNVLAGTDIKDAVIEAIRIAEEFNCLVKFDFNGVKMEIYNFSEFMEEVNYYHKNEG